MTHAYLNPKLPIEKRVSDLVARMTLDEKISQTVHEAKAIPRLGIPQYNWWSEGLHGVARAGRATVFPQAIGLAATFDTRLVQRVADAISGEARAKFNAAVKAGNRGQYRGLTFWSPNVNIFRDPRWGRGQETWGEDPFLTSKMGAAFVKGLQGTRPGSLKVAACAKHYAVHSGPERNRHTFNSVVTKRDLHETYLRAFKTLVAAGVESVMGAYNRTLDEPCCASHLLLEEILRGRWRFAGHVVSDCWAIDDFHNNHKVTAGPAESAALAMKRGCDLNCGATYAYLKEAVERGLVDEADIDRAVANLMRTRMKLGLFDPPSAGPYARVSPSVVNCDKHRALAREAAARSIVLLKNRDGILPLDRKKLKKVFVVGPNASNIDVLLGNYYGMNATMVTILEGIVGAVGDDVSVEYRMGCLLDREKLNPHDWTVGEARTSDAVVAVMGISPLMEGEEGESILSQDVGDRVDVGLPRNQVAYLRTMAAAGVRLIVVLTAGCAVSIPEVAEFADAIVYVWYPGEQGGNGVADVLFGRMSPAGRLPVTIVKGIEQLPPFDSYTMSGRTYRFLEQEPLYRFGFGLSYARFTYSGLTLSRKAIGVGDCVEVRVRVRNAGTMAADEVVQLYVRDVESSMPVPRLHLEGFERIHLKPGEIRSVTLTLTSESLSAFDDEGRPFVEPGTFEIAVGNCQPVDPAFVGKTVCLTVR